MLEIYRMPGHLIRRLNQISMSIFAERVAEAGHDLTSVQYAALSAIGARPGIDQATVAGMIAYDRVTIGGVVDRLESKGLVRRVVSKRDRRARELEITEEGARVLLELHPVVRKLQAEILAGLSSDEQNTLLDLLKRVTEAGNERSRAPMRVNANSAARSSS